MRVLGCTGGIGSGKSYVSAIFNKMGVPVYYSDDRTKELYDADPELRSNLISLLGKEILGSDGLIVRRAMAERIFSDPHLLQQVEKMVHPVVLRDFGRWKEAQEALLTEEESARSFVIFESALLLQKEIVRACADKVLVISAPLELRIERVIRRDNVTRSQVELRIGKQMSDEQMKSLADYVIVADGERALLPQIERVYNLMRE